MLWIKRNSIRLAFAVLLVATLSGCSTLNHNIGSGAPNGTEVASDRQWYILWGLVPLNNVDGGQMAKSKGLSNNYTIQSQTTFLDGIINFITSIVTVSGQTVRVLASEGASTGGQAMAPAGRSRGLYEFRKSSHRRKRLQYGLNGLSSRRQRRSQQCCGLSGNGNLLLLFGEKTGSNQCLPEIAPIKSRKHPAFEFPAIA